MVYYMALVLLYHPYIPFSVPYHINIKLTVPFSIYFHDIQDAVAGLVESHMEGHHDAIDANIQKGLEEHRYDVQNQMHNDREQVSTDILSWFEEFNADWKLSGSLHCPRLALSFTIFSVSHHLTVVLIMHFLSFLLLIHVY